MGITLHRRTGRGGWVNHWTNEPSTPNTPKFGKGLLQVGRFKKVRTIDDVVRFKTDGVNVTLIRENGTNKFTPVRDKARW